LTRSTRACCTTCTAGTSCTDLTAVFRQTSRAEWGVCVCVCVERSGARVWVDAVAAGDQWAGVCEEWLHVGFDESMLLTVTHRSCAGLQATPRLRTIRRPFVVIFAR
jgi:hypothetical protein